MSALLTNHPYASATGSLLALSVSIATIMPLFRSNQMPVAGRVVVVTGGSQGMGKAVAKLLAAKGAHIAIIARTQSRLDEALLEIRNSARDETQKFFSVSADLSNGAQAAAAFEAVREELGVPDVVWQCTGGTKPGYFVDYSSEELEREVAMNYFTAVHTAHAAVRMMRSSPTNTTTTTTTTTTTNTNTAQQKRHLIFTSSVLAFYPLAGYNTYSPCKAAIRSLADGLRQECLLYDITVHACFPATIYSPGYEEEMKTKPELTKILEGADEGQTAEQAAAACVAGLEKGERLVTTTFMGSAMRGGAWGGSPRGVVDTLFAMLLVVVWAFVGRFMDWEVVKYRRKMEKGVREL